MEAKHTPGPWHIAEYGQDNDGNPKYYGIVRGDVTIANLGMSTNENAKEKAANARLIAAAPDLLAAAKTITDCVALEQWMWDDLRAAIAKAECRE